MRKERKGSVLSEGFCFQVGKGRWLRSTKSYEAISCGKDEKMKGCGVSNFLNGIRCVENKMSMRQKMSGTAGVMLLGIALGVISKYLDCTASNRLPFIIEYLDVRNFLGRFAVWIFLALCISVYSGSPTRASANVLAFFAGMIASYYMYSKFLAGFFPKSYALVWIGFTILSPFLAFICWYSKGSGRVSFVISSAITAVLFNMTFLYGWGYLGIRSLLELLVFICGVVVVRRTTVRETIVMIAAGIICAAVLNFIIPFEFG